MAGCSTLPDAGHRVDKYVVKYGGQERMPLHITKGNTEYIY